MKNIVIEKDGYKYKWTVQGENVEACIKDIEDNKKVSLTDYEASVFAEEYGCVAEVSQIREMTHNQYRDFLASIANRLYTDESYTMDDFKRDAESVVVLGFELDKYGLPENIKKIVNDVFIYDTVNDNGTFCLCGQYADDSVIRGLADELGCEFVSGASVDGYFKNDDRKFILEFCEGDIYLVLCETKEQYRSEIISYNSFYEVDEACIEVSFDGVPMDNVYVPINMVDKTINSIARNGYENYNGAVKEDWEKVAGHNSNPKLTFKVYGFGKSEATKNSLDTVIADATNEAVTFNKNTTVLEEKSGDFII